jgi:hypothetical protein
VEVYSNQWNPLTEEERAALTDHDVRVMDCMDCHNRPSHQYLSPRHAMDEVMETEVVPRDLPFIKREASSLLATEYGSREEGLQAIEDGLRAFYAENYPDVVSTREADLELAVSGVRRVFSTNFFPYMRARWSAYPTHIGHQEFPGCFRCHGDRLATAEGKMISMDCQLCHVIMDQGPEASGYQASGPEGLEFRHPVDVGEAWRFMPCSDCHTGGGY